MLTIFSLPKPFRGHIEVIQSNAIKSWTLLQPKCEVIIFSGNEEGISEAASKLGVRHVGGVARNEYSTPFVNDAFDRAQSLATTDILCYVNSDIILMSDFAAAVEEVVRRKKCFLMAGRRWRISLTEPIAFEEGWEQRIRAEVNGRGRRDVPWAIDYFVFPKGMIHGMPPFVVGRPGWDNWMLENARKMGVPLVDATESVMAVHQDHDYAHMGGYGNFFDGPEGKRNIELAGYSREYTLDDATHMVSSSGLKPVPRIRRIKHCIRHLMNKTVLRLIR
jgi:hypothetical protein